MKPRMTSQDPSTHSELATFGEELRREREIRGISLKEIADATKISKRFLEAIERNDHPTLPAPVFTRGFVREYARYLGLNAEEIVSNYNHAAVGDTRIEQSAHLASLVNPSKPLETVQKRGIPSPWAQRSIYVTFALALLLCGSFLGIRQLRHVHKFGTAGGNSPIPVHAVHPTPRLSTEQLPPAADRSLPANQETLHLTLELTENSWVVLSADGKRIINDELLKGDRRTVEAKNQFVFDTIGNAAGVDLTLNGVHLAPFGGEGKAIHDRTLDWKVLEESSGSGGER